MSPTSAIRKWMFFMQWQCSFTMTNNDVAKSASILLERTDNDAFHRVASFTRDWYHVNSARSIAGSKSWRDSRALPNRRTFCFVVFCCFVFFLFFVFLFLFSVIIRELHPTPSIRSSLIDLYNIRFKSFTQETARNWWQTRLIEKDVLKTWKNENINTKKRGERKEKEIDIHTHTHTFSPSLSLYIYIYI